MDSGVNASLHVNCHHQIIYAKFSLKVKKAIKEKNQLFSSVKLNINNGNLLKKLQYLQNKLNDLIDTTKRQYYTRISKKLMDPTTGAKTYWSIVKTCLNDKNASCKPPLFHDNKFIIDFQGKAEFFNFFLKSMFYNR